MARTSSKQAACGGDRFHGMEWRGREWRATGDVRAGSRNFGSAWKLVDVDGAIPWG